MYFINGTLNYSQLCK